MTERVANGETFLRQRLDSLHRSVQYEPWFIKLSTLDRRLLLLILLAPVLLLIILIVAVSTTKGSPVVFGVRGELYRGELSTTSSGLECVPWDLLDRNLHTVTPDRFPGAELAGHNHCRNPDSERTIWCYTDLNNNNFDYCDTPETAKLEPSTNSSSVRDESCSQNITVLLGTGWGSSASGQYIMSSHWRNGRGLYARLGGDGQIVGDYCISWHGQFRHWWLQSCGFAGNNGGIGWLEEDARCPEGGRTWRRGGSDAVMNHTFVTKSHCMEYGREYNGTIVPGGLGNSQHTDTAMECQGLCWRMPGCQAFTWVRGNNNPCYLYHQVKDNKVNSRAVSGLATCEEKVKVGCPDSHVALSSDLCIKFLTEPCSEGCSRYAAMEQCELSGGFLLELGDRQELVKLLQEISLSPYNHQFWWTGGIDISKKPGEFVWERSNVEVDTSDLLGNRSREEEVGLQSGAGHQCLYLGPANNTRDTRLDYANCTEPLARPLCQYLTH